MLNPGSFAVPPKELTSEVSDLQELFHRACSSRCEFEVGAKRELTEGRLSSGTAVRRGAACICRNRNPTQTSRRYPIGRRILLPVWRVSMGKHSSQMSEAKVMRFHVLNENLAPLAEERMY
jgi:hypothetical protein